MHDQVAMGVRDRRADLAKQFENLPQRQPGRRHIAIHGHAGDVFHHQERPAIRGSAAIQEPRDIADVPVPPGSAAPGAGVSSP